MICHAIEKMNYFGEFGIPFIFIFDFELENPIVLPLEELRGDIIYDIRGFSNYKYEGSFPDVRIKKKKVINFFKFYKKFKELKKEFKKGNTYLLNLTFQSQIFFDNDVDLIDIFKVSKAPYKLMLKDKFVIFSPETFVTIENGVIKTFPMKGTISAKKGKEKLINNEKELAEHITIVDLLRNDLGIVSKKVWVNRFRYVERIKTNKNDLYATSSEICGELEKDYKKKIGSIIFSMLPAGSVTGAPKRKTVEIIQRLEGVKRGYYCGVFGYFDGERLDSAVMIRFVEKIGENYYYRSGGGIMMYSNPFREYRELREKIYVPVG